MFFSDSTGPCYHTDMDDPEIVDHSKLAQQIGTANRLVRDLANTPAPPSFQTGQPLATFADAATLAEVANRFTELDDLPPDVRTDVLAHRDAVNAIVAAGPSVFDAADINTVLSAALDMVDALTTGRATGSSTGPDAVGTAHAGGGAVPPGAGVPIIASSCVQ